MLVRRRDVTDRSAVRDVTLLHQDPIPGEGWAFERPIFGTFPDRATRPRRAELPEGTVLSMRRAALEPCPWRIAHSAKECAACMHWNLREAFEPAATGPRDNLGNASCCFSASLSRQHRKKKCPQNSGGPRPSLGADSSVLFGAYASAASATSIGSSHTAKRGNS